MTRPSPRPQPGPDAVADASDADAASAGARDTSTGFLGIAITLIGALLVLLSLMTLAWYGGSSGADSASDIRFADLRSLTTSFDAPGSATAYFSWLAWVLFVAVIVMGVVANLPLRAANVLRSVGLIVGVGSAAMTYYALRVLHDALAERGASGGVFQNASVGLYLALAGFAVAGLGAAMGPMRTQPDGSV